MPPERRGHAAVSAASPATALAGRRGRHGRKRAEAEIEGDTCDERDQPAAGHIEKMVRLRADVLKPYIAALASNVTRLGVPTMRPLRGLVSC